jgi:hypothetical protein
MLGDSAGMARLDRAFEVASAADDAEALGWVCFYARRRWVLPGASPGVRRRCPARRAAVARAGFAWEGAASQIFLGPAFSIRVPFPRPRPELREARSVINTLGERHFAGYASFFLGEAALARGDYAAAGQDYQDSVRFFYREVGSVGFLSPPINRLGQLALRRGALDRAAAHHSEALALAKRVGRRQGIAQSLACFARVAGADRKRGRRRCFSARPRVSD